MLIVIFILLAAGFGLVIFSIISYFSSRIEMPKEIRPKAVVSVKNYLAGKIPFVQKILERFKLDVKIQKKIDASHMKITLAQLINIKIIAMIVFGVLAFVFLGQTSPFLIVLAVLIGWVLPDIWLKGKANQRKAAIARILPETVDLLGLCIEAGLDFVTSMNWLIEKVPNNPMIEEMSFVYEEIKWGKPRSQALRDMSRRLNIPEVSSFVQTLVQAERLGTPVNEAFTILSEDTRMRRFHAGERYALKAPMKILVPLVFCILPVIGIIIGGPILLQFMGGGMLKAF